MNDLISILLPTRNRQPLLARAISSLRGQTYQAIEILVLDDASSDATPEYLDRLARAEPRLRWLRRERSEGLASALNALITHSKGDWLARMDDDDVAIPSRLERQLAYMQQQKLDVCGTWYRRVAGWRKSIARPPSNHAHIVGELLFQPPILHPSAMFRRRVFERHGGYSLSSPHAEDYELWIRLMPAVRFGNCPEVLMDYTLSDTQVSRRHNSEQLETARALRLRALQQLGIAHTSAQGEIHAHLRDPEAIQTRPQLEAIHEWLIALTASLDPLAQFAVRRQWFLQCVRAAGLGPDTYRLFSESTLTIENNSTRALLWGLCQFRLRYRSPLYNRLEPLAGIG